MAKVEDAIASYERNIETQSGRSLNAWSALVSEQKFGKHGQMVGWLKEEHKLSHAHANHIAKRVMREESSPTSDDPFAPIFAGSKTGLRPLYDLLAGAAVKFGHDVELAPKKANISLRRTKQFALVQPSTRTRLDLGLILKGKLPQGRLEASGSFNAMFTHRVKISDLSEIDDELLAWLREAYDNAL